MCQGGKPDTGKFHSSYIGMNVCGSTYENGCVVDGTCATAVLLLFYLLTVCERLDIIEALLVTLCEKVDNQAIDIQGILDALTANTPAK